MYIKGSESGEFTVYSEKNCPYNKRICGIGNISASPDNTPCLSSKNNKICVFLKVGILESKKGIRSWSFEYNCTRALDFIIR